MWEHDFNPIISLKVFSEVKFSQAIENGYSYYRNINIDDPGYHQRFDSLPESPISKYAIHHRECIHLFLLELGLASPLADPADKIGPQLPQGSTLTSGADETVRWFWAPLGPILAVSYGWGG